jgi:hypothetical protein
VSTPKLLSADRLADLMSEVPSQEWVDEAMSHIVALEANNAALWRIAHELDENAEASIAHGKRTARRYELLDALEQAHHGVTLIKEREKDGAIAHERLRAYEEAEDASMRAQQDAGISPRASAEAIQVLAKARDEAERTVLMMVGARFGVIMDGASWEGVESGVKAAMMRARNKGREHAAVQCDARAKAAENDGNMEQAGAFHRAANIIRALKEPEE